MTNQDTRIPIFDYTPQTWEERAACAVAGDLDTFFPAQERSHNGGDSRAVKFAKSICARCPVQTDCLARAIETDSRWGVWGGLTAKERDELVIGDTA